MSHLADDQRARILTALAEPVRMAMVDHLLLGDASPSELGAHVGLGSNLLAHHLRVLDDAGIIRRVRSEGDRRRSYVHLRTEHPLVLAAAATGATGLPPAPRVLFVCTANTARSQRAAATWNEHSTIPAASAGTHPGPRIHPRTIATADRHGLQLSADQPLPLGGQLRAGDLVVAVCDNAHEELDPHQARLHWAIPDPVRVDTDAAFEAAYTDINRRVRHLTAVYNDSRKASRAHQPGPPTASTPKSPSTPPSSGSATSFAASTAPKPSNASSAPSYDQLATPPPSPSPAPGGRAVRPSAARRGHPA